jgi:hypothetical protein
VTYIVCDTGGYHDLYEAAKGATDGMQVTAETVLDASQDSAWGSLR